jgi:sulfoxide reductase heme-binding subunit YedZ
VAEWRRRWRLSLLRWAVHVGAWVPFLRIVVDYLRHTLSANPIQEITLRTGKAALVLLVLSLAVSPLYALVGYKPVLKVRRTLGLYAFSYVTLHFLIFVGVDYGFDWGLLREALLEKRYALVGFAAGLILLPLALTSTKGWMARLGRNWKRLHRLVYLAGILAVVHYIWLVKSDIRQPLFYGGIVLLLLFMRLAIVRRWVKGVRERWTVRLSSFRRGYVRLKFHLPFLSRRL